MPDPIHSRLGVHLVITPDALLSSLRHMLRYQASAYYTVTSRDGQPGYLVITLLSHPQAALERVNQL